MRVLTQDNDDRLEQFSPKPLGEVASAAFELGERHNIFHNLFTFSTIRDDLDERSTKTLSPQEVKTRYGLETQEPMSELFAQWTYDMKEDKKRLESIVERAPDTFIGGAVNFISRMAGTAADPLPVAAGGLIGLGMSGLTVGTTTAFQGLVGTTGMSAMRALGTEAAIDFAANMGMEYMVKNTQEEMLEEYGWDQMLLGAGMATSIGVGVMKGVPMLVQSIKNSKMFGPKLSQFTKTLLDNDLDPSQSFRFIDAELAARGAVDDTFWKAFDETFGEGKRAILGEPENLLDVLATMKGLFEEGKVKLGDVNALEGNLRKNGFDKWEFFERDFNPGLTEATRKAIADDLNAQTKVVIPEDEVDVAAVSLGGKKIETVEDLNRLATDNTEIENSIRKAAQENPEIYADDIKALDEFKSTETDLNAKIKQEEFFITCVGGLNA